MSSDYLLPGFYLELSHTVANLAVNLLVQSSLILTAGLLAAWVLRRRGPAVQSCVLRVTLLAVLLCPLASWSLHHTGFSGLRIELAPAFAVNQQADAAAPSPTTDMPAGEENFDGDIEYAVGARPMGTDATRMDWRMSEWTSPHATRAQEAASNADPVSRRSAGSPSSTPAQSEAGYLGWLYAGITGAWLVVSVLLIIRLGAANLLMARLRRRAAAAPGEIHSDCRAVAEKLRVAAPPVLVSRQVSTPCLVGWLRPAIVIPDSLRSVSSDILTHELAHLVRRDCHWSFLAHATVALIPWQPLLWLVSRRLQQTADEVCDDYVVAHSHDRTSYAHELVDIAERLPANWPATTAGVGVVEFKSCLGRRVQRILDSSRSLTLRIGIATLMLILSAAAAATLLVGLLGADRTSVALAAVSDQSGQTGHEPLDEDFTLLARSDKSKSGAYKNANTGRIGTPAEQRTSHKPVSVRGRVVYPDGTPAKDATVFVGLPDMGYNELHIRVAKPLRLNVGKDGSFSVEYSPRDLFTNPDSVPAYLWEIADTEIRVAAVADGYGPAWIRGAERNGNTPVTLRLIPDRPIEGRLISIEGTPVANARLRIKYLESAPEEDIQPWIDSLKKGKSLANARTDHKLRRFFMDVIERPVELRTSADGRFRIRGAGKDRVVRLIVSGPSAARQIFSMISRDIEQLPTNVSAHDFHGATVYGSKADNIVVAPSRPIVGTVRDAVTGKGMADVTIESYQFGRSGGLGSRQDLLRTKTDAAGRFQLEGMPLLEGNRLIAVPGDNLPYFIREVVVPQPEGFAPIELEIELHRGLWIEGKVVDKATGEPVSASMHYLPFLDNEFAANLPEFNSLGNSFVDGAQGYQHRHPTRADGSFRIVGLPGRAIVGAVTLRGPSGESYRRGAGSELIGGADEKGRFATYSAPLKASRDWPNVMIEVDPPPDAESVSVTLEADSGVAIPIHVTDPDGKPLTGCRVNGQGSSSLWGEPMTKSHFVLSGLARHQERTILVLHEERNLGKAIRIAAGDGRSGTHDVQLEKCCTVKGRLVDTNGEPIVDAELRAWTEPSMNFNPYLKDTVTTDEQGRFEFTKVPAGCAYRLTGRSSNNMQRIEVIRFNAKAGATIELGEIDVTTGHRQELGAQRADNDRLHYKGQVLRPDGKPAEGARVHLFYWTDSSQKLDPNPLAVTDTDGRFEFSRTKGDFPPYFQMPAWVSASIVAVADGYGLAFAPSEVFEKTGNARLDMPGVFVARFKKFFGRQQPILELVKDDTPIRGRIVDLEGRGVAGVSVQLCEVWATKQQDLSAWEKAAKRRGVDFLTLRQKARMVLNSWGPANGPNIAFVPSVHTEMDGHFELRGVGRERIAALVVSGPRSEVGYFHARTRQGEKLLVPMDRQLPEGRTATFYATDFVHALGPSRPVNGTVKDIDTNKPVAGVSIQALQVANDPMPFRRNQLTTMTDQQGRFRLIGLPLGQNRIVAINRSRQPYLRSAATVTIEASTDAKHDFRLKRGVWLEGQVTDKTTQKAVRGHIDYFTFATNPNVSKAPGFRHASVWRLYTTDREGRYRIPVLPGRGLIAFTAERMFDYPRGVVAQGSQTPNDRGFYETVPRMIGQVEYHYIASVEAKENIERARLDIELSSGRTVTGRVVDANNQPLQGTYFSGFADVSPWMLLDSAEFSVQSYLAERPRKLLFYHPERNLSGSLILRGEPPETIAKLGPAGTIKGRIVDADGTPLPELTLHSLIEFGLDQGTIPWDGGQKFQWATDKDGRFQLKGLVPGMKYRVAAEGDRNIDGRRVRGGVGYVIDGESVEPGEVKDLGDIQLK